MMPDLNWILSEMKRLGYLVFESRDYDLNVVSIRNKAGKPDSFDDWIACFYRLGGAWKFHIWKATTDPGLYYLRNPMNVAGTAVLCPGQYRRSHRIGLHQGKYEAMVQVGTLRVFRDNNKNSVIDFINPTPAQGAGINIHKAGLQSTVVDRWSAGCQVFSRESDFNEFMRLVKMQRDVAKLGDSITLTLLEY